MYLERLRDLRINKELTQQDIANYLYTSAKQYGRYERGERELSVSQLDALADYYKVTADYILGRSDDPHRTILNQK